jgi:hypothetical protein
MFRHPCAYGAQEVQNLESSISVLALDLLMARHRVPMLVEGDLIAVDFAFFQCDGELGLGRRQVMIVDQLLDTSFTLLGGHFGTSIYGRHVCRAWRGLRYAKP